MVLTIQFKQCELSVFKKSYLPQKKALSGNLQKGLLNLKKIYQTLISTSTPEGNSSFIKASTVLAEAL